MYCIPLVKRIVFLENQLAQEQTYIPINVFPNPNYGIKAINYNKLPSSIVSSRQLLFTSLRGLSRSHSSIQTQSSIYQIKSNLV